MLKFPPVKFHKISDYFVIKTRLKNSKAYNYRMFDIKGENVGCMKAYPDNISNSARLFSPNFDFYRSFYIDRLFVFRRNQGIGKSFIKIAKKESLRNFCSGNVHVISSGHFDKRNPSHIFYRKQGFQLNKYSKNTEKYLDDCIKNNKQVEQGVCPENIPMFIEKCTFNQTEELNKFFNFKVKFSEIFDYL